MSPVIVAVIVSALFYAFRNGVNDSSGIVATMISSRASSMRTALGITAIAEFFGPLIIGTTVANTISRIAINSADISSHVVLAAILAAILWNLFTAFIGLPSSSSHALIGGLIGSVIVSAGAQSIRIAGLVKILLSLLLSPLIGFIMGFIIFRLIMRISWNASPQINEFFKRSQVLTVIALGLSHGSNDAPKTMGMITLALLADGYINTFSVPIWVVLISSLAIAMGTAVGGQRIIRTVGGKFYKITPIDAFSSQLSSALVIVTSSILGGPVSATHVLSSSIMGVGAAERPNKVRWKIALDILTAWFLTIPIVAILSAGLSLLFDKLL